MGLNIKNDETCALIRELSQLTGESMTRAVSVAVRERLEREQRRRRRASAAELLEIGGTFETACAFARSRRSLL